ncbi:hypothetical protein FD14_GL002355 [Secundilactobacillus similis DSM 23365 = JCM 2765]|uniref:Uncharacterized protein n=1 Tax=Secundilactobacillus similis DSM 23365 = JCM 2765 TaxID=1423804 RepID=A0A0R2FCM9_9LACO|nr:hypothetical protein FD14_GL002355 [Secundilactobacillus similis DSM 23365 = JCM 2765]
MLKWKETKRGIQLEIDVPATMAEVEQAVADRQAAGETVTVDDVIKQTVKDSLQAYLDYSEEGHYDSAKWQDADLAVFDVTNDPIATVKPQGESFVADFKQSPDALFFYLQDEAMKIAGVR